MYLKCICGYVMHDIVFPGKIEHLLLSSHAQEKLQDLVDKEADNNTTIDMWPEHWEDAGAEEVWHCFKCNRLYIGINNSSEDWKEKVLIYKLEQEGINNQPTGLDSGQIINQEMEEKQYIDKVKQEQSGNSPLEIS